MKVMKQVRLSAGLRMMPVFRLLVLLIIQIIRDSLNLAMPVRGLVKVMPVRVSLRRVL